MLPPLVNQPVTPGQLPTREHHEFLMGLYRQLLANTDAITALQAAGGHYQTIGPFSRGNIAGTASTALQFFFADGASTFAMQQVDIIAPLAGRVIGISLLSNAARTAGTATARVLINGSSTAFDGGSVQLNATNLTRDSSLVAYSSGLTFTAGNRLGVEIVTSGWTPTTADMTAWLTVKYEAF